MNFYVLGQAVTKSEYKFLNMLFNKPAERLVHVNRPAVKLGTNSVLNATVNNAPAPEVEKLSRLEQFKLFKAIKATSKRHNTTLNIASSIVENNYKLAVRLNQDIMKKNSDTTLDITFSIAENNAKSRIRSTQKNKESAFFVDVTGMISKYTTDIYGRQRVQKLSDDELKTLIPDKKFSDNQVKHSGILTKFAEKTLYALRWIKSLFEVY